MRIALIYLRETEDGLTTRGVIRVYKVKDKDFLEKVNASDISEDELSIWIDEHGKELSVIPIDHVMTIPTL